MLRTRQLFQPTPFPLLLFCLSLFFSLMKIRSLQLGNAPIGVTFVTDKLHEAFDRVELKSSVIFECSVDVYIFVVNLITFGNVIHRVHMFSSTHRVHPTLIELERYFRWAFFSLDRHWGDSVPWLSLLKKSPVLTISNDW